MKKTITAIAVLLAVLLGSCAETGGGEAQNSAQSSAEATAQTEAVTKDAETSALEDPNAVTTDMVVPSAELTDMDGISEAENCTVYDTDMDLDKELEGYAVYEATKDEYCQYYNGSEDSPEMPDKFAVRFTDVDNFAFIVEKQEGIYSTSPIQYITAIYHRAVKIEQIKDIVYGGPLIDIVFTDDNIFIGMFNGMIIGNTEQINHATYGYFLNENGAKYYENDSSKTGFMIRFYADESGEKMIYSEYNLKYFKAQQFLSSILEAYTTDDEIDRKDGELIISDGKIKKNELNVYTVAESYCLDSPIMFEGWKKYFEMYNVTTIKELAAIYNQYKDEGRESEFLKD